MYMTLWEISHQYAADAAAFSQRIRQLKQQMAAEPDPAQRQLLRQRIGALRPLLRQSLALARVTAHYYDRGYRRNVKYTI